MIAKDSRGNALHIGDAVMSIAHNDSVIKTGAFGYVSSISSRVCDMIAVKWVDGVPYRGWECAMHCCDIVKIY